MAFADLIMVYLLLILGSLLLVWFGREIFRSRRERRERRRLVICNICDHVFEDRSERKLLTCPRCGRLNERSTVREI